MFKKGMLAAGALMLAVSVTNVQTVHAQAKVETTQEAEGRKILEKFLTSGFAFKVAPNIGKIEYNKAEGSIVASDVSFDIQGVKGGYKEISIAGYKEDPASGGYSINTMLFSGLSVKIDAKTLKEIKAPNSPAFTELSMEKLEYSGISGSYEKGMMSVKNATGSGMKVTMPNAPDLSKIKISMSGLKTKNLKEISEFQQKMVELFKTRPQPGAPMPPEMLKYMTLIYNSVSWDKISVSGFPAIPAPDGRGSFQFGEMYLGKFADGVAEEITLKDINVQNPNNPTITDAKIGKLAILGFDILGFIQHSSTITPGTPPTPEQGAKMFQFVKGFSIQGVDFKGPAQEITGNMDVSWGNFVGLFPTKFNWNSHSIITAPKDAPAGPGYAAFLKMAGLDKLDLKSSMGIEWNEKANIITIKPFKYDAEKLADVEFSASIGNVTKAMLEERDMGKLSVLAMGANVGTITLKVSDKGAQKLADETTKGMWSAMSAEFAADPALQPVIENITKLLNEPGNTLTIVLKPKGEMSFAQVSGAIVLGPKMLPTLFDIETSLEK